MIHTKTLFAAVLAALVPVLAAAAELPPSAKACNPETLQTNDYVTCLEKALAAAERDVATLVAKASGEIAKGDLDAPENEKTKALLDAAQASWRKYRDAECAAYARHTAGLGFGAMQFRLACLVDETALRAGMLKSRYDLR